MLLFETTTNKGYIYDARSDVIYKKHKLGGGGGGGVDGRGQAGQDGELATNIDNLFNINYKFEMVGFKKVIISRCEVTKSFNFLILRVKWLEFILVKVKNYFKIFLKFFF